VTQITDNQRLMNVIKSNTLYTSINNTLLIKINQENMNTK